MKVVYIAGPYRGKNAWEVEQNIRRAEEVAFKVAELGCAPLCPHTMYRYFNGTITDEFWLDATAALVRISNSVVMVEGWDVSSGSNDERDLALDIPIPVFYEDEGWQAFIDWVTYIPTRPPKPTWRQIEHAKNLAKMRGK